MGFPVDAIGKSRVYGSSLNNAELERLNEKVTDRKIRLVVWGHSLILVAIMLFAIFTALLMAGKWIAPGNPQPLEKEETKMSDNQSKKTPSTKSEQQSSTQSSSESKVTIPPQPEEKTDSATGPSKTWKPNRSVKRPPRKMKK